MDNRGLDEWPGLLAPDCVGEAVGLCCVGEALASNCVEEDVASNCVEEAVASNCVEEDVASNCVEEAVASNRAVETVTVTLVSVETEPPGPVIVLVIFKVREVIDLGELDWAVSVGCGVALAGVIGGSVETKYCESSGQPNPEQGSTEQQPENGGLEHV